MDQLLKLDTVREGDEVILSTEFWDCATDIILKFNSRPRRHDEDRLAWRPAAPRRIQQLTGEVKWLGTLKSVSDSQMFAGIETVLCITSLIM